MRLFFKKYVFTYVIYFIIARRNFDKLPNRKNSFFLTGFPRSGNSYFTNLIKYCKPDLNFSNHLHTIASIKMALNKNILVLVIFRSPLDSISSLYVMKNKSVQINQLLLQSLLKEYIDYYEFLNKNRRDLNFISFEKVTVNPNYFIEELINVLPKFNFTDDDKTRMNHFVEGDVVKKKQEKMSSTHSLQFSSTPNQKRNLLKKEIIELLKQDSCFSKAQQLFINLTR
jgi:hypothetical protein